MSLFQIFLNKQKNNSNEMKGGCLQQVRSPSPPPALRPSGVLSGRGWSVTPEPVVHSFLARVRASSRQLAGRYRLRLLNVHTRTRAAAHQIATPAPEPAVQVPLRAPTPREALARVHGIGRTESRFRV